MQTLSIGEFALRLGVQFKGKSGHSRFLYRRHTVAAALGFRYLVGTEPALRARSSAG